MKQKLNGLSQRYVTALRKQLKQGPQASLKPALKLGREAVTLGVETLGLARIHEQALAALELSDATNAFTKLAGIFFTEANTLIEETHQAARQSQAHLSKVISRLRRRTQELAVCNRQLQRGADRRKVMEDDFAKRGKLHRESLEESLELQKRLRRLTHQAMEAQENERKKISRELQDVIAQTLTGINIRLATLKKETAVNTKGLDRNIARTQRLVERSVEIVYQFAGELRPAVLDDLGLIPALHSFVKLFFKRTHIRVHLKVFAGVEQLDINKRTTLYRVAQEALTNVSRHAQASRVEINIEKIPGGVCMKVNDHGKSFVTDRRRRVGFATRREVDLVERSW